MNKTRWYYFAEGKREGSKIVACYTEAGRLDKVALMFCTTRAYCKLYPVYHKGLDTISEPVTIHAHDYIATRKIQNFKEN